ncbi:MAG: hypothetical protein U0835_19200 [Isosphaeraceae bacterium]
MSAKHSRALRAGLESLERRDNPSTISLSNTGTAFIVRSQPVINGQKVVTQVIATSKAVGQYVADFEVFYGIASNLGRGNGTITTANGDTIKLKLHSSIGIPTAPTGNRGKIAFTVDGGTGAYANAKGHGTLTGNVNFIYTFPYALNARIRTS